MIAQYNEYVYLAGKMTGEPFFGKPKFDAAAKKLREEGYFVFNPIENDEAKTGIDFMKDCPTGSHDEIKHVPLSYRTCMKDDLSWICEHATAIALLPDWYKSRGAQVELQLAKLLGLKEIYLD